MTKIISSANISEVSSHDRNFISSAGSSAYPHLRRCLRQLRRRLPALLLEAELLLSPGGASRRVSRGLVCQLLLHGLPVCSTLRGRLRRSLLMIGCRLPELLSMCLRWRSGSFPIGYPSAPTLYGTASTPRSLPLVSRSRLQLLSTSSLLKSDQLT